MDERNKKLASTLVNYSCALKPGEKVLIEAKGSGAIPLVDEVVKEVYRVGALPFVEYNVESTERLLHKGIKEEQLKLMAEWGTARMNAMDAYMRISAPNNTSELSDVPPENQDIISRIFYKPVHFGIRIPSTKWVVLRYPTPNMAQMAKMSLESFEDFYYDVCTLDYRKLSEAMNPLVELMERTDKVRVVGKDLDLSFSIKGMKAVKCDGDRNIPDGEIYTAPIKDSVNGYITYNTPSESKGFTFSDIHFEFKDGRIVKATSNDTERLNKILDTDDGARYIGEFSIGVNPYILKPMLDTLFDEKIMGSFHLTPGNCYKEADNGNESAIHWDLVFIQTPEYGGGEIYFDDVCIRKDGRFVLPELFGLNPENLK